MKKNILIIHYNTPYLTECLVRSINFFVKDAIIYIFDNSDKSPFTAKFDNVTILDNTKGQIINFEKWLEKFPDREKSSAFRNNYGSAKHCYSIDKCMDILGENFILMDSDILLKKDISKLIDDNLVFVGSTELWKAATPMPGSYPMPKKRAVPYLCYINVKMCKKYAIKYFNEKYMYGLSPMGDSYDTGTYFFEQLMRKGLKWKKINCNEYMVHYKACSWLDSAKKYDKYNPLSIEKWLEVHKNLWNNIPIKKKSKTNYKKVVYTCITGDYDNLLPPQVISDGFDYICFTDNKEIKSDVWKIMPIPDEIDNLPQIKKQRFIKINPHLLLKDYDASIWVDGNVEITGNLNSFLDNNINDNIFVYVPKHPSRNCIYAEEKIVISMKKDTIENTSQQINKYKEEQFPKNNGLLQSNILFRFHNNEKCIKLMETWWEEVKNGSHRDQLSFNYASWKNPETEIKYLDKYIYNSEWFKWHKTHSKKTIQNSLQSHNAKKSIQEIKANFENVIKRKNEINYGNINKRMKMQGYY